MEAYHLPIFHPAWSTRNRWRSNGRGRRLTVTVPLKFTSARSGRFIIGSPCISILRSVTLIRMVPPGVLASPHRRKIEVAVGVHDLDGVVDLAVQDRHGVV